MKMALLLALLLVPCASSTAQESSRRIPVYVDAQCSNDPVGSTLAYNTRNAINSSSLMVLATSYTASVVQLKIVCLNPSPDDDGNVSKYAYSITALNTGGYYDYEISFGVGDCGARRISECAQDLVASVDDGILDLRKRIAGGSFKFKAR